MVKKVDGKETRVLRPKRIGPRGFVKPESRESLDYLVAEKREGRKVLGVLTVLEGNCSRYGEAVNIVTDPVTMCRHAVSEVCVIKTKTLYPEPPSGSVGN